MYIRNLFHSILRCTEPCWPVKSRQAPTKSACVSSTSVGRKASFFSCHMTSNETLNSEGLNWNSAEKWVVNESKKIILVSINILDSCLAYYSCIWNYKYLEYSYQIYFLNNLTWIWVHSCKAISYNVKKLLMLEV